MFILDTNVVSELRKVRSGRVDLNVLNWADGQDPASLYLSAITIHELSIGVLRAERKDASQGAVLRAWLDNHVLPVFQGRVLPVDAVVALRSSLFHVPDPRPLHDGLIAATAFVHGMKLVTRNTADFAGMGVSLLDPWHPVT